MKKKRVKEIAKKAICMLVACAFALSLVPCTAFAAAGDATWIKEGNDGSQSISATDVTEEGKATSKIDVFVGADKMEVNHRLSVGFDWNDQSMAYQMSKLTKTWNTRTLEWETQAESGDWVAGSNSAQATVRNRSSLPVEAYATVESKDGLNIKSDTTSTNQLQLASALDHEEKSGKINFTGQPSYPQALGLVEVPVTFHVNKKNAPSHTLTLEQQAGIQFSDVSGATITNLSVADGESASFKINVTDPAKAIDSVRFVSDDGCVCKLAADNDKIYKTPQMTSDATVSVVLKDAPVVQSVGLDKSRLVFESGATESQTLKAHLYPVGSDQCANVEWSTSDKSVATVTQDANDKTKATVVPATPAKNGVVTVKAKVGSMEADCIVSVGSLAVTDITLNKSSIDNMNLNDTETIQATISPAEALNHEVKWESSNPDVVALSAATTVPEEGKAYSEVKVSAKAGGKATITATSVESGQSKSCEVTVKPTVVYDGNGATATAEKPIPAPVSVNYNTSINPEPTQPESIGLLFGGWYKDRECTEANKVFFGTGDDATKFTQDSTIYAKWGSVKSNITLNAPDATTTYTPDALVAEYGEAMPTLNATQIPVREGYKFVGFEDANHVKYYDGEGKSVKNWDKVDAAVELNALWEAKKAAIVYDPCGGVAGTTTVAEATYGQALPSITTGELPSKPKNDFVGYFDQPNGQGKQYYDNKGSVKVATWDKTDSSAVLYANYTLALCFTAQEANSTVKYVNNGGNTPDVQYSTDGVTWATWNPNTDITLANVGDKVYVKGNNPKGFSFSQSKYSNFAMTGKIAASGNIMSLIDNGACTTTKIPCNSCYNDMFKGCTSLTTAPELPATTLADYCYSGMFYGCTSLTTAPELPATTIDVGCYWGMFKGCTSLTTAPQLPSGDSYYCCYSEMFSGCTALTTAPELPATWAARFCYQSMFNGCTSLTTAPELPATFLGENSYQNMFNGCTSLTTAPELPATTLDKSCYQSMFSGCTSLTNVPKTLPATFLGEDCYQSMFEGCTSLTTAPELPAKSVARYCYHRMFSGCESLTTAPELPATELADYCYMRMFNGCTSLTTAPQLPATELAKGCYENMFSGCFDLTSTPTQLPATKLANQCYYGMFKNCTSLTTAPELPATTLAQKCYGGMFSGCIALTTAPELSATTLADYCYSGMFSGCTSLTTAPQLPATTLAQSCYSEMFSGCTSLTNVPKTLPATTLAILCYDNMFYDCTSLTTAPELPATELAYGCYSSMFKGCTSLTTAPELPATTLANNCYRGMLAFCTNLNNIKIAYTGNFSHDYFDGWVYEVSATGDFYYNGTDTTRGTSAIPNGWTVHTF